MFERIAVALGFLAFLVTAVLSSIIPAVNIIMTALVIGVFVTGAILTVRFLIIMNARPWPQKATHRTPEPIKAVNRS